MQFELWEFMEALGRNILNFIYSYIFYSHIDVYLYVCTLRVSVCPLDTVRELDVQQEFQKSYGVILGIFYVHSECGLFQKKVHISNFDS